MCNRAGGNGRCASHPVAGIVDFGPCLCGIIRCRCVVKIYRSHPCEPATGSEPRAGASGQIRDHLVLVFSEKLREALRDKTPLTLCSVGHTRNPVLTRVNDPPVGPRHGPAGLGMGPRPMAVRTERVPLSSMRFGSPVVVLSPSRRSLARAARQLTMPSCDGVSVPADFRLQRPAVRQCRTRPPDARSS
jgi:hypothetical protein